MRVIGGQERGRKLAAPRGKDTRPATARVRASIFSRLVSRNAIAGARVLDVFAGSGSFGVEALSRGASHAVFVDRARQAAAAIAYNLSQLHLRCRARIVTADFRGALAELAKAGECFGVVFIDAPFSEDSTDEVLAQIAALTISPRWTRGYTAVSSDSGAGGRRVEMHQRCKNRRSPDCPVPAAREWRCTLGCVCVASRHGTFAARHRD